MSAVTPNRCTGATARVRGVILPSRSLGSRVKLSSISTNTGVAPSDRTTSALATYE